MHLVKPVEPKRFLGITDALFRRAAEIASGRADDAAAGSG
jgi:hypothetical protein